MKNLSSYLLGYENHLIEELLATIKCGLAKLPVTYLGIPLGANPRKILTWKPIIEKVEKRLAMWKANTLLKQEDWSLSSQFLITFRFITLASSKSQRTWPNALFKCKRDFFGKKGQHQRGVTWLLGMLFRGLLIKAGSGLETFWSEMQRYYLNGGGNSQIIRTPCERKLSAPSIILGILEIFNRLEIEASQALGAKL